MQTTTPEGELRRAKAALRRAGYEARQIAEELQASIVRLRSAATVAAMQTRAAMRAAGVTEVR